MFVRYAFQNNWINLNDTLYVIQYLQVDSRKVKMLQKLTPLPLYGLEERQLLFIYLLALQ